MTWVPPARGPVDRARAGRGGLWFARFHQVPDLPERMVAGRERAYLDWFFQLDHLT